MQITAKFASVCPKCSEDISIGDKVEWVRGNRAEHVTCPVPAKPQGDTISFMLVSEDEEDTYSGTRWGRPKENPVITVDVNELEILRLEGELDALRYDHPIDEEMSDGEWTPEGYRRYVDHFYMMRDGEMDSLRARIKKLRGH